MRLCLCTLVIATLGCAGLMGPALPDVLADQGFPGVAHQVQQAVSRGGTQMDIADRLSSRGLGDLSMPVTLDDGVDRALVGGEELTGCAWGGLGVTCAIGATLTARIDPGALEVQCRDQAGGVFPSSLRLKVPQVELGDPVAVEVYDLRTCWRAGGANLHIRWRPQ